jgi:type II secretory ATPase GspE/PulE/Tfp pilus assembly ATPase PilB-like protein
VIAPERVDGAVLEGAAIARMLSAVDALRFGVVPLRLEADLLTIGVGSAGLGAPSDPVRAQLAKLLGRAYAVSPRFVRAGEPSFTEETLSDADLHAKIADVYGLTEPEKNAVSHIARDVALRNHVLPLRIEQHALFVGVLKMPDDAVREKLGREAGGLEILPLLMSGATLHAKQRLAYRLDRVATTQVAGSSAAQRARAFIDKGVKMRAEDIHFESTRFGGRIRANRGGTYTTLAEVNPDEFKQLTGALRGDASIDSGNDLTAVVGTKEFEFEGRKIESRLTTAPTEAHAPDHLGLQLVVRLHDVDAAPKRYKDLGMSQSLARIVRAAFRYRNGVTFIVGPPDSGKNTTAKTLIEDLPLEKMKVCTAESPVELQIDYVQHHKVTVHNTYAQITQRLMQLNTQLLYQAECLDEEGAAAIAGVGNFGRKGLTTMHTDSCKSAFRRAKRLGFAAGDLAEFLNLIIAQRIIRVVCRKCSTTTDQIPEFLRARRADVQSVRVASEAGCEFCDYTGYSRKTAVFEVMVVTEEIREAIAADATASEIEQLALKRPEFGFRPLLEDALDRVVDGTTTLDEIASIVSLGDDFMSLAKDDDDSWWAA